MVSIDEAIQMADDADLILVCLISKSDAYDYKYLQIKCFDLS